MKIFIAIITFVSTMSLLLARELPDKDTAQIAKFANNSTPAQINKVPQSSSSKKIFLQKTLAPSVSISPLIYIEKDISNQTTSVISMTSTPLVTAVIMPAISPSQQATNSSQPAIIATYTPIETPTNNSPATISPSPTLIATSQHIFYTSSHWKTKYYYCDTDKNWQSLSKTYLKIFESKEALLLEFPNRILHQPCE